MRGLLTQRRADVFVGFDHRQPPPISDEETQVGIGRVSHDIDAQTLWFMLQLGKKVPSPGGTEKMQHIKIGRGGGPSELLFKGPALLTQAFSCHHHLQFRIIA